MVIKGSCKLYKTHFDFRQEIVYLESFQITQKGFVKLKLKSAYYIVTLSKL